ncbi:MAG: DUF3631 domain-containing protein [Candidatus Peribacteraceae bacterium]|jgi:hypothetical protein
MSSKLTPNDIQTDHEALLADEARLKHLTDVRGFTLDTIKQYKIGLASHYSWLWYSFPVNDVHGTCVFKKLKKLPDGSGAQSKGMVYPGGRNAQLYPLQSLDLKNCPVVFCEGEPDTLIARQLGFNAYCGTAGAETFDEEWLGILQRFPEAIDVYFLYDNDEAGGKGMEAACLLLATRLPKWRLHRIEWPDHFKKEKGDVTDFVHLHHSDDAAGELLALCKRYVPPSQEDVLKESLRRDGNQRTIMPLQAFADDTAYYTVTLFQDGNLQLFTVTSKRECFHCAPEEFARRGFRIARMPVPSEQIRWDQQQLLDYLDGAEALSLGDVFQLIVDKLAYYVDLPDQRLYECIALWILGTYFYLIFHAFPYLHIFGLFQSGKTKIVQIAVLLGFNGIMTTNTTAPALFRLVHSNGAVCGLDEADQLNRAKDDVSAAILQILRTGYKRGGSIPRCETIKEQIVVVGYDPYSPKAIAGTKPLEIALHSRCIPLTMLRSKNAQIANREVNVDSREWADLRSLIYPAALQVFGTIQRTLLEFQTNDLSARQAEIWRPILVLAKIADPSGSLSDRMLTLAREIEQQRQLESDDETQSEFLLCLFHLLQGEKEAFITATDIYDALYNQADEFQWLNDERNKGKRGKWLSTMLKRLDLWHGGGKVKSIDGTNRRGYLIKQSKITEIAERLGVTLAGAADPLASVRPVSDGPTSPS